MLFQHTLTSKNIADIPFAHQLTRRLTAVCMQGIVQGLYPDGNAQVAIAYENHAPIAIATPAISTHHAPSLSLCDLRYQLIECVMKPVTPDRLPSHRAINRVGGPKADAGLTGRKIIVGTHGGIPVTLSRAC